jgi:hypothetical protein
MVISVVNHTSMSVADEELQAVVRAINRQIQEDFRPYWSLDALLHVEGRAGTQPDKQETSELRGDAVLYLWDDVDVDNALGYHDRNNSGIPYGFVFTALAAQLGEPWSVTLSHEALELIGDPYVNLLVIGPHPTETERDVLYWYEMCDAVQAETYEIDHVPVSNFLLPLYFTVEQEAVGRNDYLGRVHEGHPLESFGINPGGYVGFWDPQTGQHETYSRKEDAEAQKRLALKADAGETRRVIRYQEFDPTARRDDAQLRALSADLLGRPAFEPISPEGVGAR